jgi:hypothetical protein
MQLLETTTANQTQSSIIHALGAFTRWVDTLQKNLTAAIFVGSELEVKQIVYGDEILWFAFNPQTGQQLYTDSEAELRQWIDANYQEY